MADFNRQKERWPSWRWLWLCCGLLGFLWAGCQRSETGTGPSFVDDPGHVLSSTQLKHVADYHARLLQDLDVHLQVTLLKESPPDLDAEAVRLFDVYGLGRATAGARGVLLLVDPKAGEIRIEVGYDLEGVLTDAWVGNVASAQLAPFFAAGRVADGVLAAVELLVVRLLEDPRSATATSGELPHLSGGAGARTAAPIDTGLPSPVPATQRFLPGSDPLATLDTYLQVLSAHVKDPELDLYTAESRSFFRKWLVTDAQQNNERRSLLAALPKATVFEDGDLAVVRFPAADRQHNPYFLRRSAQGWQLDFASMSSLIGFNHKNQWFFRNRNHPFMFAFNDWSFDENGFPRLTQSP